jgi:hypothetical protein
MLMIIPPPLFAAGSLASLVFIDKVRSSHHPMEQSAAARDRRAAGRKHPRFAAKMRRKGAAKPRVRGATRGASVNFTEARHRRARARGPCPYQRSANSPCRSGSHDLKTPHATPKSQPKLKIQSAEYRPRSMSFF